MADLIRLDIQPNRAQLDNVRRLTERIPGGLGTVVTRAINKTAAAARTQITREIKRQTSLKLSDIRKSIALYRATRKYWQARLDVHGKRMPLFTLKGRRGRAKKVSWLTSEKQTAWLQHNVYQGQEGGPGPYKITQKKYISGTYEVRGQRQTLPPGAFWATMPSGHQGFFMRVPGAAKQIRELMGPSAGGMVGNQRKFKKLIRNYQQKHLVQQMDTQVRVLLKQKGRA